MSHKYNLSAFLITCYPQYVEEWISYYLSVGVEHFGIYDNDETGKVHEKLIPYINEGLVDYEYHSKWFREFNLFHKYLSEHGQESKWIIKADNDEFIFPENYRTLIEEINGIERIYKSRHTREIGFIYLDWIEFGGCGILKYENKPMMERFKYCSDYNLDPTIELGHSLNETTQGKIILNPLSCRYTDCWDHVPMRLYDGYDCINVAGEVIKDNSLLPHKNLFLHHYRYRSLEEFNDQRLNVKTIYNGKVCTEEDMDSWEDHNSVEYFNIKNDLADRFLPKLYRTMKHYRNLNEHI